MGFSRPKFGIKRSCASRQFELGHHAHDGHEVEVIFLRIDFKLVPKFYRSKSLNQSEDTFWHQSVQKNQF